MTQPTRTLLEDVPTNSDAFSAGGHERVSNSLARTLVALDARDAVVGLDGSWGSGKSSVIEMAQKRLPAVSGGKNFYVMTYDLWSNQSQYFRRSFLEQFIQWALAEKDLTGDTAKRKHLKDVAKKIGGREQVTETTTETHFNFLGAIFVLFIPLLPIFYVWLSPLAIRPSATPACTQNCPEIPLMQSFLLNYATTISVVLLGLLAAIALGKYISLLRKGFGILGSLKKLAVLVERKTEDNIETKLIRDVDPSNTEFSKTFRQLLGNLQAPNKRIVVVFDNIDRLSAENVTLAWSDLQAVLSRQCAPSNETNLTAVIPYARKVVAGALFAKTEQSENVDEQDLFRKSFDTIHHVSPPVVSDIDSFVKAQMLLALGDQIDDAARERVARVFDLYGKADIKTPRQVTAFVNDVSNLWVEWDAAIPVDAVSVFIANYEEIAAGRSDATITQICQGPFSYRVSCSSGELEEFIAMMTFSAPKELAMEIALGGPVEKHLVEKDSEIFQNELSNSAAFPVILGRVLDDRAQEIASELQQFENALGNLAALGSSKETVAAARTKLADQLMYLEPAGDPEDVHLYRNVLSLPEHLDGGSLNSSVSALSDWLSRALSGDASKDSESYGRYWIEAVAQIRDAILRRPNSVNPWTNLQKSISVPQREALVFGAALHSHSYDLPLDNFETKGMINKMINFLVKKIDDVDPNTPTAFKSLRPILNPRSAKQIFNKIVERVNTLSISDFDDSEKIIGLLSLYPIVARNLNRETVKEQSKALVENGSVFRCLETISEAQDVWDSIELAELCIHLMDAIRFKLPTQNHHSYQGHNTLGNISSSISWFNDTLLKGSNSVCDVGKVAEAAERLELGFQFIYFAGSPDDEKQRITLYRDVASVLLENEPRLLLRDEDFVSGFTRLYELNSKGTLNYGTQKDKRPSAWKDVDPLNLNINLIEAISNEHVQEWPKLLEKVDGALSERGADAWTEDLSNNSTTLSLLENRLSYGGLKFPTAQLKKPLRDHLVAIVTSKQEPADGVSALLGEMSTTSLKSLRQSFLEHLVTKPVEGSRLLVLHSAAPDFLSGLDLVGNPSVVFEKVLLPMLDVPSPEVETFLIDCAQAFASVIEDLGEEASEQTAELLATMIDTEDFDRERIASVFGLELPRAEPVVKNEGDQ
ncbi:P-loop NTPase fold protein [Tritonibacter scottomollicae]|uniref:P-loop NTPase fold protein n=1 Tax=Tritonibacter scottomollicae TaxID=483013 RepID=UPI003BAAE1EA